MMERLGRWLNEQLEEGIQKENLDMRTARVQLVEAHIQVMEDRAAMLEQVVDQHTHKSQRRDGN